MENTEKIIELTEKIERNTEPKASTQIVVSENSTKIKTTFNPPLELDRTRKYEMVLVNVETYYSFPNLSDENNVFRYSPGFIEVGRGDEDDSTRHNGSKFKFQKAVTISLILQKQ